ncbi:MAG TPA: hypothetical protein DCK97_14175, partial [Tistrella mobilis]|nr:hypothetical protein [Tistrella mobilis]
TVALSSGPLVATLGLRNTVVVATEDAVLVADASRVQEIRTVVDRLRMDRLAAIAREAAEQCERLTVPSIHAPEPLDTVLDRLDDLPVVFGDETGAGRPAAAVAAMLGDGPAGLLTGPEGGFDPAELDRLRARPHLTAIGLGPRVLRAETAVIAGLAVLQALAPDGGGARHRPGPPTSLPG